MAPSMVILVVCLRLKIQFLERILPPLLELEHQVLPTIRNLQTMLLVQLKSPWHLKAKAHHILTLAPSTAKNSAAKSKEVASGPHKEHGNVLGKWPKSSRKEFLSSKKERASDE